jgi:hypothetical protein
MSAFGYNNLSAAALIVALACPLFFEWLRHRPYNRPRSTVYLTWIGGLGCPVFLGLSWWLWRQYEMTPLFLHAHHMVVVRVAMNSVWLAVGKATLLVAAGVLLQFVLGRVLPETKGNASANCAMSCLGWLVFIACIAVAGVLVAASLDPLRHVR